MDVCECDATRTWLLAQMRILTIGFWSSGTAGFASVLTCLAVHGLTMSTTHTRTHVDTQKETQK